MSVLLNWIGITTEPDAHHSTRVIRDFVRNLERLADGEEAAR